MSDDLTNRDPKDRDRVNVNEPYELKCTRVVTAGRCMECPY